MFLFTHLLYLIPFLHQTTTRSNFASSCLLLYLIPFLHQTTTCLFGTILSNLLYLIPFLHQTTTILMSRYKEICCILFHFYIKPQPVSEYGPKSFVVSYSISTSNHNQRTGGKSRSVLYLIPFLHQTTTSIKPRVFITSCILFHFYIKPQPSYVNSNTSLVVSYSISTSNHNIWHVT